MEIKIYGETEIPEKRLILRLVQEGDSVMLVAVQDSGCNDDCGILLEVTSDGTILLYGGVNPDIGLQITKAGYVKTTKRGYCNMCSEE